MFILFFFILLALAFLTLFIVLVYFGYFTDFGSKFIEIKFLVESNIIIILFFLRYAFVQILGDFLLRVKLHSFFSYVYSRF